MKTKITTAMSRSLKTEYRDIAERIFMIQVFDRFTSNPIVQLCYSLPAPGLYHSVVTDAYTAIIHPFYGNEDTCLVVEYKLVNVSTLEEYIFKETYYPYRSNPRSVKFFSYLCKHFSVHYDEDEAIIGLREKVEINWDVLGGYAYPVVARRWFIDLPQSYKENYLNEQEKEDMED
ncbi:MAG: hypothetical protein IIX44_11915 [Clostridia bacterium]|nr:hypothetical protein [Clostridia bacterium]